MPVRGVVVACVLFPVCLLSIFLGGLAKSLLTLVIDLSLAAYLIPDLITVAVALEQRDAAQPPHEEITE